MLKKRKEAYSETCQTSKMEICVILVSSFNMFAIFEKYSILEVLWY